MGQLLLLVLMYIQWSKDTLHKQDAFRCHQPYSLHIERILAGTLTPIVASDETKIVVGVQIYYILKQFSFAIGSY